MKINEIAKKVITEQQYVLIRARKDQTGEYDCKEHEGNKKGWVFFDGITASAVNSVYNALSVERQQKYINMPLSKLIDVTWKCIKR